MTVLDLGLARDCMDRVRLVTMGSIMYMILVYDNTSAMHSIIK
jgi:hypothetical protein